jgi:tetratricopeptide (TPR) repeat protein
VPTKRPVFDDARISELGPTGMMQALVPRAHVPEHPDTTQAQRRALAEGVEIVDRAVAVLGVHEDLGVIRSMMLGKLGDAAAAIENARTYHRRAPTWRTAATLGNALRRGGDDDGAVAAFREAAALDPEDVTSLLDAGDILLRAERWSEAARTYGDALARERDHAWAGPSACFARYRATGDRAALAELRSMARQPLDECGVGGILAQLTGGYSDDQRIERAKALLAEVEPAAPPKPKVKSKSKIKSKSIKKSKTGAKTNAQSKSRSKSKSKSKPPSRRRRSR